MTQKNQGYLQGYLLKDGFPAVPSRIEILHMGTDMHIVFAEHAGTVFDPEGLDDRIPGWVWNMIIGKDLDGFRRGDPVPVADLDADDRAALAPWLGSGEEKEENNAE